MHLWKGLREQYMDETADERGAFEEDQCVVEALLVERDAAKADFSEYALDCRQAVHSRRLQHAAVTSHK